MSMYDEVEGRCPDCGEIIIFQSKADTCEGIRYDEDNVPIKIAKDLDGEDTICPTCGVKLGCVTEMVCIFRLKKKR